MCMSMQVSVNVYHKSIDCIGISFHIDQSLCNESKVKTRNLKCSVENKESAAFCCVAVPNQIDGFTQC